ncbi:MAG: TIM barrel protein [Candidatus Bathyarchaeota archaeon]|nr:TIM barrel protein [Candidatus Termiticorpusculum sp.]MCL1970265.1 TIM barrel protein [Candidatus Termiticorpusculum sp.]
MVEQTRFGTAGVPPAFRLLKAKMHDVPSLLREEGLNAFEYQAVRWGAQPQIAQRDAEKLGDEAKKHDVRLSVHGSYFINLAGKDDVISASKERIIAGAVAADWMGAQVLVFHTGFYGKLEKSYAFKSCLNALKEVSQTIAGMNLKVKLGPETMGRKFQVGSIDEIMIICQEIENVQLVVDWGHLHARDLGAFKKVDDVRAVAEKIESTLGSKVLQGMHCHFSKIEFSSQGERKHHPLDELRYGPEFELLAKVIVDFKMHPTLICETPLLDIDALKMKNMLQQASEGKTCDNPQQKLFF